MALNQQEQNDMMWASDPGQMQAQHDLNIGWGNTIPNPETGNSSDRWIPVEGFGGWQEAWRPHAKQFEGKDYLPSSTYMTLNPAAGDPSTWSLLKNPLALGALAFGGGALMGGGAEAGGWLSGFDLPGGGDLMGGMSNLASSPSAWTSGYDLAGGGALQQQGGAGSFIEQLLKRYGLGKGGNASGIMNLLSSGIGLYQSGRARNTAERASSMENPFGPERAKYAGMLSNLMSNPDSITSMPGYKAGLTAVERKMASQGYVGSGNMGAALQEYGGKFFNDEAARLSRLAGADFGPGGGNQLIAGNRDANDLLSKSLASLGFSLRDFSSIFGGN